MRVFILKSGKVRRLKIKPFKTEKEIQTIVERNLKNIFNLEFIAHEFQIGKLRIDTLAFDPQSKSFVVIEYKKDKYFSVIDQGFAYLSVMLRRKAEFVLKYNEEKNENKKKGYFDWSQSRVIFISPQFTAYQKELLSFKDLPFELWEIKRYEGDIIIFNQITPTDSGAYIKLKELAKGYKEISREVRVYTEEYHLKGKPEEIVELYNDLKRRILELGDNIEIRPRKRYIGFIANTNFVDVHLKKSKIKLWINLKKGELDDPKKIARDVSEIGHWGNGDYEISLDPNTDLDYIMMLIKQSYQKHSS